MADKNNTKVSMKIDKAVHKRLKYIEIDNDCDNITEAIMVALDAYDKAQKSK